MAKVIKISVAGGVGTRGASDSQSAEGGQSSRETVQALQVPQRDSHDDSPGPTTGQPAAISLYYPTVETVEAAGEVTTNARYTNYRIEYEFPPRAAQPPAGCKLDSSLSEIKENWIRLIPDSVGEPGLVEAWNAKIDCRKWYEYNDFNIFSLYSLSDKSYFNREQASNLGRENSDYVYNFPYADVKSEYNYYIPEYEKIIGEDGENTSDVLLPNLYVFLAEESASSRKQVITNGTLQRFITLDGRIVYNPEKPTGDYFEEYKRQIIGFRDPELQGKFRNVILPVDEMAYFNSLNGKELTFPMSITADVAMSPSKEFAILLEKTKLADPFLSYVVKQAVNQNSEFYNVEFQTATETVEATTGDIVDPNLKLRKLNISNWLNNLKLSLGPEVLSAFTVHPSPQYVLLDRAGDIEQTPNDSSTYNLFKSVMLMIFGTRFQQLLDNYSLNIQNILEGKPAYSETVAYCVAKRNKGTHMDPIQKTFFFNADKMEVFKFVDTQVKYEKDYIYDVYAYQFVLGSKYSFIEMVPLENGEKRVRVHLKPALNIFEFRICSEDVKVYDYPPVRPDVRAIVYRGVNNKIMFQINGGVGRNVEVPVIFNTFDERDKKQALNEYLVQKIQKGGENGYFPKMIFEADDFPVAFEIYRIEDEPPKKIEDFETNHLTTMFLEKVTSGGYLDNIKPNTKYYYIFRSLDIHGHVSNPTIPFEIELIDDDGAVYPIIRPYYFKIEPPYQVAKDFKSIIQIVPNLSQLIVKDVPTGVNQAKVLPGGNGQDGVWSNATNSLGGATQRKYKLRITSKQTGKKIDVNFEFRVAPVNRG